MARLSQKIIVMGLGYIGLPTASMLATKGHQVLGVDVSEHAVNTINSGRIHIIEPDLDILVRSAVNSGNLKASLTPEEGDTFIIAVPTPFMEVDGNPKAPDLTYVEAATRALVPYLREGNLVILESTSPVGTTEFIYKTIVEMRPELAGKIHAAHCPERVLPGHILRELVDNDRIVGGLTKTANEQAQELYKSFCNGAILLTDSKTAELSKLVENSFRDVNIAFANELSLICDHLGINVWETISLANRHPRVNILQPGPGVGGHCIAVDPWFIVSSAPEQAKLIKTARQVNDAKPLWVIDKVKAKAARFKDPVIACLGLAFKANIDDTRESPSLEIVKDLIAQNVGRVMACDPNVRAEKLSFPLYDLKQVLKDADILLLLVDHTEFKEIDPDSIRDKVVIDTRGVLR
ncbi:UDP-N-acetyl-D-mannosamine dehydrogenase [Rhodoferax antarcticus]|uniref:UDP-N-acetyl-D-mannosamine dehydrogenase n=1 Tax=Rhodoferax antarcticus ANT.BR TaxID=1111071 RepID=A0A1Q8YHA2_9BURK|nr:UDP-N-acetyl-D-mannosamine dehydrogenase [Rhodoferax antarcticus]APW45081.1 UDP-N-acetyl-D-mannosamine dehydrogenase [Rhodoferax antarcticus]MCW2313669.1 UDP-N-acetyl-D-mannosaminuronic acid dehydrogenase [Rhodoferax antarcticus]OLP07299.1 UDP-N-acetyl-D-mannosamine dehydrogenase [Rhodoferax antarcticus ANT.BR]